MRGGRVLSKYSTGVGTMGYVFQFGPVWDNRDLLLAGALTTLRLSVTAFVLGLALSALLAYLRSAGSRWLSTAVAFYADLIRNTPFLIQLFVFYFSLPAVGIRLGAAEAALLVMTINFSGYGVEILRSGIEAVHRGQFEAGESLGLSRFQTYRHIVLHQAIHTAYPALVSQFVLLMLGSSVISSISVTELTAVTNTLQSTTFRSFEFYFVATAIYLCMAVVLRMILGVIYWKVFVSPVKAGGAR